MVSEVYGEMVTGFATLAENRNVSTGGQIKRTSVYDEIVFVYMEKK